MQWWQAALWALAGGFVVEGLEFAALLRQERKWPWQVDAEDAGIADSSAAGPWGYFIGEMVRLAAGAVLGAALASEITGPLPAVAVGAAAPVLAKRLVDFIPLPASSDAAVDAPPASLAQTTHDATPDVAPSCDPEQALITASQTPAQERALSKKEPPNEREAAK